MIHKIHKARALGRTLTYVMRKTGAERITGTVTGESPPEVARTMRLLTRLRPELGRAVFHVSLSAAPGEHLTAEQWARIVDDYMARMGFEGCMYLACRHSDASRDHVHVVALRVSVFGKAVPDSQDYVRGMAILRDIEAREGLQVAQRGQRELPWTDVLRVRRGLLPFRQAVATFAGQDLEEARSWRELLERLAAKGLLLLRRKSGLVITDGISHARLGDVPPFTYSFQHLRRRLGEIHDGFFEQWNRWHAGRELRGPGSAAPEHGGRGAEPGDRGPDGAPATQRPGESRPAGAAGATENTAGPPARAERTLGGDTPVGAGDREPARDDAGPDRPGRGPDGGAAQGGGQRGPGADQSTEGDGEGLILRRPGDHLPPGPAALEDVDTKRGAPGLGDPPAGAGLPLDSEPPVPALESDTPGEAVAAGRALGHDAVPPDDAGAAASVRQAAEGGREDDIGALIGLLEQHAEVATLDTEVRAARKAVEHARRALDDARGLPFGRQLDRHADLARAERRLRAAEAERSTRRPASKIEGDVVRLTRHLSRAELGRLSPAQHAQISRMSKRVREASSGLGR